MGFAARADFRRLYPANAKTPTCCPSDDNRTKVTNSVTSARSLWWHVGPYFWPADRTRTANPILNLVLTCVIGFLLFNASQLLKLGDGPRARLLGCTHVKLCYMRGNFPTMCKLPGVPLDRASLFRTYGQTIDWKHHKTPPPP